MFNFKFLTKEKHPTTQDIVNEKIAHPNRPFAIECNVYDFDDVKIKQLLSNNCCVCIHHADNFSKTQIEEFISIGKNHLNTILLGDNLGEDRLTKYINDGATVLLKKEDGLNNFELTRLSRAGGSRVNIHTKGITNFRLQKFLEEKSIITLGDEHKLSKATIKANIRNFKHQVHLRSNHFQDKNWLTTVEGMGAVIV